MSLSILVSVRELPLASSMNETCTARVFSSPVIPHFNTNKMSGHFNLNLETVKTAARARIKSNEFTF